jgi:hypothetical protein
VNGYEVVWNGTCDRQPTRPAPRPRRANNGTTRTVRAWIAQQVEPFTSAQMAKALALGRNLAAVYLSQAYRQGLVTRTATPCRRRLANGHTFALVARVYRTVRA